VVEGGVDIVDTDGIHLSMSVIAYASLHITYTQLLHNHSIAKTHVCVGESVFTRRWLVTGLTSRLVVNTNNHQALVCDCVDKVLAADFDRVDGMRDAREQGGEAYERANELSGR
jgi:hypothetical protein